MLEVPQDRPKGLLVDLNETLFDNSFVGRALEPACEAITAKVPSISVDCLTATYAAVFSQIWPERWPKCLIGELDALELSRQVWRRALQASGSDDPAIVDFAHAIHQQFLTDMSRVFDDVPEFLHALTVAAIPVAVVTNGSCDLQLAKLRSVGLEHAFSEIVISAEVAVTKPDPAIFQVALDRLDLNAADVWHVGDSLRSDIGGARALGILGVWLNRDGASRGASDPIPDVEIRSLLDLIPALTQGRHGLTEEP